MHSPNVDLAALLRSAMNRAQLVEGGATATLLLKAQVPLAVVRRILGHASPTVAAGVYGHLDVEDMRAGLE
ncbi:hypothetical protein [Myxococcus xanthus]|uniref:hypothetical protein n=1 Tax=Myxococcus xanthus TaxID=34 RepID=UPI001129F6A7|nr:hypothetical protein [Myxococcus xanthus]QDF06670.1 hypothetical protein BHS04_26245 [Myxococcus xanthus]